MQQTAGAPAPVQATADGVPNVYNKADFANGTLPPARGARDVLFAVLWAFSLLSTVALLGYGGVRHANDEPPPDLNATYVAAHGNVAVYRYGGAAYNRYAPIAAQYAAAHGEHAELALAPSSSSSSSSSSSGSHGGPGQPWDDDFIARLGLGCAASSLGGVIVCLVFIALISRCARQLIIVTLVLNVAIWLLAAGAWAVFAVTHDATIVPAIALGIIGLLMGLFYFLLRRRIPFAAAVLTTVGRVVRLLPATVVVSFVSLLLLALWTALWVATFVFTSMWANNDDVPSGVRYALWVYLVLSFYWTQQVIKNVLHVTVSGAFATYYFLGGNNGAMPPNPTLGSLRRALTTSFGSICLGSLIVAVIKTVRAMLRSLRTSRGGACLVCIIDCLLSWIESIVKYFNTYAFVQVAIYGSSFCEAAKATFALISSHGIMAILNDLIIGRVLALAAVVAFVFCGAFGFAGGYVALAGHSDAIFGGVIAAVAGAIIGVVMLSQVTQVVDSGVVTIFVAFAMDPAALKNNDPALADLFAQSYSLV